MNFRCSISWSIRCVASDTRFPARMIRMLMSASFSPSLLRRSFNSFITKTSNPWEVLNENDSMTFCRTISFFWLRSPGRSLHWMSLILSSNPVRVCRRWEDPPRDNAFNNSGNRPEKFPSTAIPSVFVGSVERDRRSAQDSRSVSTVFSSASRGWARMILSRVEPVRMRTAFPSDEKEASTALKRESIPARALRTLL